MRKSVKMYLLYGVAVLGLLGWAEYRGWSMLPTREERAGPQSVRDNPGAHLDVIGKSFKWDRGEVQLHGAVTGFGALQCALANAGLVPGVRLVVDFMVLEPGPRTVTCLAPRVFASSPQP